MEMTLSQRRLKHAEWAKRMAADYRREAGETSGDRQSHLLENARRMDDEAAWAERSAEYM